MVRALSYAVPVVPGKLGRALTRSGCGWGANDFFYGASSRRRCDQAGQAFACTFR